MTRRQSSSPLLPLLTAESRVEASQARQDRIVAEIGDWIVDGSREEIQRFYSAIGQLDPVDPQPRLLAIAGRQHTSRPEILIRRGIQNTQRNYGQPLLAGKIVSASHIIEGRNPSPSRIGRRLYFQGTLNPTRFVVHQPKFIRGRSIIDPVHGELPEIRMFTRSERNEPGDEAALDGRDNVIVTHRGLSYARPEAWQRHLERYLLAIPEVLDEELQEYADEAGVSIRMLPRSRIQTVETYWEFEVSDPTAFVRRIASTVMRLGRNTQRRTYDVASSRTDVDGNQVSIRAEFQTGGVLKVYAKTQRRVRFEVEHNGDYFQRIPRNFPRLQGHASGWVPLLGYLATQAAPVVNHLLQLIGEHAASIHENRNPFELAVRLVHVLGSPEAARELVSILANDGRIVIGPKLIPRDKARALMADGVLTRVPIGRGVYAIAPGYASALTYLQAFRPPGVRRRSRRPT